MDREEKLSDIWSGDQLGRRNEAEAIEHFLNGEVRFFQRTSRERSVVLGIDAPYGRGKTWFLDKLVRQLRLSHPVAKIDAWSDDFGDEPLVAFMSSIDEALSPYLSRSRRLSDRLAGAKAAAIPVIGKIVSGVALKAASKIAGDEIDQQIGSAIEDAVRGAREQQTPGEDGAASVAMTEAFEKLGSEIDALVDRQGAAMLAAYKQRKQSREVFRRNMRDLVAIIDKSGSGLKSPLIVVVDELDRCRPSYAIKMLEEIKHFFEVPGVVFIIGLHGGQLSKSVNAVYGPDFDSDDYLRRFFTRRYELKSVSIVDLVVSVFEEWGIPHDVFDGVNLTVDDGYVLTRPKMVGLILSQWQVTPREVYYVMDGLRLFVESWEHKEKIDPIVVLMLLVKLVRGIKLDLGPIEERGLLSINGISWIDHNSGNPCTFSISEYLDNMRSLSSNKLSTSMNERRSSDGARNCVIAVLSTEYRSRMSSSHDPTALKSYILQYVERVKRLASFVELP